MHANHDQTAQPNLTFCVLGCVEVIRDGRALDLGGRQPRSVMAILALQANHVVQADQLKDALWGSTWPDGATNTVQAFIARLRRALGEHAGDQSAMIVTSLGGYMLRIDPDDVDLHRSQRLANDARLARDRGDHAAAAALFEDALARWDPDPLVGVCDQHFARLEIARLQDLRLGISEERFTNDLDRGRHVEVLGELVSAVQCHPSSERLVELLMTALYRCDRQTDALAAYEAHRARLDEEVGLDPGPKLRLLQRQILTHDADVAGPEHSVATASTVGLSVTEQDESRSNGLTGRDHTPEPRPFADPGGGRGAAARAPRRALPVIAIIALLAIGLAAALKLAGDAGSQESVAPPPLRAVANSTVRIDPRTDRIQAVIRTGPDPDEPTPAPGGIIWVLTTNGATAISEATDRSQILHGLAPSGIAFAHPGLLLLASSQTHTLWFSDSVAGTGSRLSGRSPLTLPVGVRDVSYLAGSIWVNNPVRDEVYRINPTNGRVEATIHVGDNPSGYLAYGDGSVWAPNNSSQSVTRIDTSTDRTTTIRLPQAPSTADEGYGPAGVAYAHGSVWVSISGVQLAQIDPETDHVVRMIHIGNRPFVYGSGVAAGLHAIWVASGGDGTVSRVDPVTGAVTHIQLGKNLVPLGVTTSAHSVWVTVEGQF